MTHPARIKRLVDLPPRTGKYVLYWMQQSQRTRSNPALEEAIGQANALHLPVIVGFGLMDDYPEANARHYAFMLQGLADVGANLEKRGIRFVVRHGHPAEVAAELAKDAALVIADRGYLRHQKAWRDQLAQACTKLECPLIQIEGDAIVPVDVASNKREWAARTIRPKIHRHLKEFLTPIKPNKPKTTLPRYTGGSERLSRRLSASGQGGGSSNAKMTADIDWSTPTAALANLKLDRSISTVEQHFKGGENEAHNRLQHFLKHKLKGYDQGRNEPAADHTSHLSPYLHFGQISPVEIALAISTQTCEDSQAYLEEMIVRRELSINYCNTTEHYDTYDALPAWAKQTLNDHEQDPRPALYTRAQLESAQTDDPYWNAAQTEMVHTGFMHNYMRMYWGKKIIEWTQSPREAFDTALYLNNRYFLDGRDPNSYTSVAWLFGLHDRPWGPPRPVFGTVRYMNAAGLKRKFDMDAYVKRVMSLSV